jgi:hypothetical protein
VLDAQTQDKMSSRLFLKVKYNCVMSRFMDSSAAHRVARFAALLLYVLATLTVGFAHRPVGSPSSLDLSQFALPGGVLPIICGKTDTGEQTDRTAHVSVCEACCLTSAPGLQSPPAAEFVLRERTTAVVWTKLEPLAQSFWTVVALGARGPPVV